MGAQRFTVDARGRTAKEAFDAAVEQAQHDYGHRGYTGTIAEKGGDGFEMVTVPAGRSPDDVVRLLFEEDPRADDKWGPALCVRRTFDGDNSLFTFVGSASS